MATGRHATISVPIGTIADFLMQFATEGVTVREFGQRTPGFAKPEEIDRLLEDLGRLARELQNHTLGGFFVEIHGLLIPETEEAVSTERRGERARIYQLLLPGQKESQPRKP